MADNTQLNVGTGGDLFVSEDNGDATKIAVSKIYIGVHGTKGAPVAASNPMPVGGGVASGATDAGNPVKVGGVYHASAITLTDAQRGDLQLDASGNLKVNVVVGGGGSSTPTASELHLGEVGGNSDQITITPTVSTTPAYSVGDVVGGKQTLTGALRVSGGKGLLQSMVLIDASNQKPSLDILIFDSDPTGGTYTDNGAFAANAADMAKLIRRVTITAADWTTFGTYAVADLDALSKVVKASGSANLYAVIVVGGISTPTFATTTALTIRFGLLRD